jgi:hypothetical protein
MDALDAKAIPLEGVEVVAPGDQVDVGTGLGEPASEVSSDSSGAVDRGFHALVLLVAVNGG